MQAPSEHTQPGLLRGLITEANLAEAEREFPGIIAFYRTCADQPRTFLELAWRFQAYCQAARARH